MMISTAEILEDRLMKEFGSGSWHFVGRNLKFCGLMALFGT